MAHKRCIIKLPNYEYHTKGSPTPRQLQTCLKITNQKDTTEKTRICDLCHWKTVSNFLYLFIWCIPFDLLWFPPLNRRNPPWRAALKMVATWRDQHNLKPFPSCWLVLWSAANTTLYGTFVIAETCLFGVNWYLLFMLHHFFAYHFVFSFFVVRQPVTALNSCEHSEIATFLTFHLHFFWCCKPTPWSHTDASGSKPLSFWHKHEAVKQHQSGGQPNLPLRKSRWFCLQKWWAHCHMDSIKTTIAKDFLWRLHQVNPAFQTHSLLFISILLTFLKNAVACSKLSIWVGNCFVFVPPPCGRSTASGVWDVNFWHVEIPWFPGVPFWVPTGWWFQMLSIHPIQKCEPHCNHIEGRATYQKQTQQTGKRGKRTTSKEQNVNITSSCQKVFFRWTDKLTEFHMMTVTQLSYIQLYPTMFAKKL